MSGTSLTLQAFEGATDRIPNLKLEGVFRCEVASRSLIDAGSRIYVRVNEVAREQALSRSLVFPTAQPFNRRGREYSVSGIGTMRFRPEPMQLVERVPGHASTSSSGSQISGMSPLASLSTAIITLRRRA
jgi:hypothetical protein